MESTESLKRQIMELEKSKKKADEYSGLVARKKELMTGIRSSGMPLKTPSMFGRIASATERYGSKTAQFAKKHKIAERARRFSDSMEKQLKPSGNV